MLADALAGECECGSMTAASKRIEIGGVLPYVPGCMLESGILYVVRAEDAGRLGGWEARREAAIRRDGGLYLIVVGRMSRGLGLERCDYLLSREGMSFEAVLVAALQALRRFQVWHERLADELLGACDLNALCQISSETLRVPLMIYDKNYAVIGNSLPEDEAAAADHMEKRSSYYVTKPDALGRLMRQPGFADTFKTRGAALYYDEGAPAEAFGDRSLYVNLGRGAAYLGRVVAIYDGEDPRPGDFQAIELVCDAVRMAIRRPSLREGDLDRVFRAYFVSMLEGRAVDDRLLSDSLRLWNWPRIGRYVCLWARLTQVSISAEADAFLCYRLEMELTGSCAVRYGEGIACVVPVGEGGSAQAVRDRFEELAADMVEAIGSSELYADALLTDEYFAEARIAADICAEMGIRVCRFGDVALRHFRAYGCSQLPPVHFCDEDVKRLLPYRGQRKDYYAILKCYLEHNMSLLQTSEALFVHRTTLFNYVKEIRALIDANLDDPEARLRMLASFEIMGPDT